jgi:hypothetical protein
MPSVYRPTWPKNAPLSASHGKPANLSTVAIRNAEKLELRPANHLEHIGCRRLLVERFAQLAAARLHLIEQPHVLDGDHRLVGESFEQLDLPVGEQPGFPARHEDRPDDPPLAKHRHPEAAPVPARPCRLLLLVARIGEHVRDMHDRTSPDRARRNGLVAAPHRKRALHRLHAASATPWRKTKWISSPSTLETTLTSASQSFSARSPMILNTGCTSVGDRLITLSTSLVAVCCSNDSRSSLSSRAFSIAITA